MDSLHFTHTTIWTLQRVTNFQMSLPSLIKLRISKSLRQKISVIKRKSKQDLHFLSPARSPRTEREREQLLVHPSVSKVASIMSHVEDEGSERPKLVLQPRGSPNDTPSTTPKASRPNPFGAARPREQVIAEREGKQETDVLKEQAKKEWKPQIALTEAQREEKKAAEAELAFAKNELENEEDEEKASALREEVASKERKLEELIASFEKVGVQSAQSSSTRRPFEKRREDNLQPMQYSGSVGREGSLGDSFGNFRGRARDNSNDRFFSYGDTWGGARRAGGQSECYTCGEIGHFSRECPRGGSYGATFGGGRGGGSSRSCYTCGQEGHFSRDCPQASSFGSRSGGYGGAQSYGGAFGGNQSGYGFAEYGDGGARYFDERGEYVGQGGR